jgi:hypothetical protein
MSTETKDGNNETLVAARVVTTLIDAINEKKLPSGPIQGVIRGDILQGFGITETAITGNDFHGKVVYITNGGVNAYTFKPFVLEVQIGADGTQTVVQHDTAQANNNFKSFESVGSTLRVTNTNGINSSGGTANGALIYEPIIQVSDISALMRTVDDRENQLGHTNFIDPGSSVTVSDFNPSARCLGVSDYSIDPVEGPSFSTEGSRVMRVKTVSGPVTSKGVFGGPRMVDPLDPSSTVGPSMISVAEFNALHPTVNSDFVDSATTKHFPIFNSQGYDMPSVGRFSQRAYASNLLAHHLEGRVNIRSPVLKTDSTVPSLDGFASGGTLRVGGIMQMVILQKDNLGSLITETVIDLTTRSVTPVSNEVVALLKAPVDMALVAPFGHTGLWSSPGPNFYARTNVDRPPPLPWRKVEQDSLEFPATHGISILESAASFDYGNSAFTATVAGVYDFKSDLLITRSGGTGNGSLFGQAMIFRDSNEGFVLVRAFGYEVLKINSSVNGTFLSQASGLCHLEKGDKVVHAVMSDFDGVIAATGMGPGGMVPGGPTSTGRQRYSTMKVVRLNSHSEDATSSYGTNVFPVEVNSAIDVWTQRKGLAHGIEIGLRVKIPVGTTIETQPRLNDYTVVSNLYSTDSPSKVVHIAGVSGDMSFSMDYVSLISGKLQNNLNGQQWAPTSIEVSNPMLKMAIEVMLSGLRRQGYVLTNDEVIGLATGGRVEMEKLASASFFGDVGHFFKKTVVPALLSAGKVAGNLLLDEAEDLAHSGIDALTGKARNTMQKVIMPRGAYDMYDRGRIPEASVGSMLHKSFHMMNPRDLISHPSLDHK